MTTTAQPLTTQQPPPQQARWDFIGEARKRYPGLAKEADQSIIEHFSSPENFRSAFPEYSHLSDEDIAGNMASYAKQPNLPGATPQLLDAVKTGKAPGAPTQATPFEQERTDGERGVGAAIKHAIPGLFASPDESTAQLAGVRDPGKPSQPANQWSFSERVKRGWQAGGADPRGKLGTAISYAVGPFLGMDPQAAEEKAARGDTSGILGQAAVPVAQAVAPLAAEALQPVVKPVASAIERTGSRAVQAVREIGQPEAHEALVKALKTPKRAADAGERLALAGPDVQASAKAAGKPIRTIDDLLDHAQQAKKNVWQEYEQTIGPNKAVSVDGNRVADSMMQSLDARAKAQNPGLVDKVTKISDTYRRPLSLGEAEDFLQSANNELDSYYKLNKVGRDAARKAPGMSHVVAEADALRDSLYGKLDEVSTGDARGIKQRYGALSDLQSWALDRKPVYERGQQIGLTETLGRLAGAGDIAKGIVTGNPADIVAGMTKRGVAKYIRDINDTNKLIEKAFNGPKAFEAHVIEQPRQLPPAPERQLKTGPGGSPPAVPFANRVEPTGRVEGPTALGTRGKGGVPAPKLLPAPREASTSPPAVPFKNRIEATGTGPADIAALGPRGEGGTIGGRKLLPAPKPPHPSTQPSGIMKPTSGASAIPFLREEAKPPAEPYTPHELEEAELLVRQTHDVMASGDRPGRYYSQNEMGDYNPQKEQSASKGVTAGGHWFGVQSIRTKLPWIHDTKFTPSQLERALRPGGNAYLREQVLNSAADYIRREKAHAGGEGAAARSAKEAREQYIRPPEAPRGAGQGEPPAEMHAAELEEIRRETGRPDLSVEEAQRYRIAKLARTAAETKPSNDLGGIKRAGD